MWVEITLEHDNFFGKIDDLRFYKTALSEDQILEIYNDDITGRPIVDPANR